MQVTGKCPPQALQSQALTHEGLCGRARPLINVKLSMVHTAALSRLPISHSHTPGSAYTEPPDQMHSQVAPEVALNMLITMGMSKPRKYNVQVYRKFRHV